MIEGLANIFNGVAYAVGVTMLVILGVCFMLGAAYLILFLLFAFIDSLGR